MRRCALALVAASLFALPVQGAVTLVSSTGGVQISAMVGTPPILPGPNLPAFGHNMPRTDSGLFQQSLHDVLSSPQYGTVSAMASQVSSFTTTGGQFAEASFAGTSAITAATVSPMASSASANSLLSFVFEVTGEPVQYDLSGNLTPLGIVGVFVALKDAATGAYITSVSSGGAATQPFARSGLLQMGTYSLESSVLCFSPLAPAVLAQACSLEYTFAVTPEPASLALLALGGLAVVRRRR